MSSFRLLFKSEHLALRLPYSVAVFDVVNSARRPSPFVLLQPHLRLQDIFPSTARLRDYPIDGETAFVGLVPGTDSLYALSTDHFPLVAFSESEPAKRVEGVEGRLVWTEDGMLQCFEGTTDRRCLTGVRDLRADSRSRLARLLDGVPGPGPATPPLASATGGPARSENANSQAYEGSEPHVVLGEGKTPPVPWEWIANVPESLAQNQKSWTPSPSTVLLALVSVVASLLWFRRKEPIGTRHVIVPELAGKAAVAGNAVSITPLGPANGATHASHLESQAVENGPSTEAPLPKDSVSRMKLPPGIPTPAPEAVPDAPLQSSTTDDSAKASPVQTESPEGAEDVGEVKKKHRKRRRKRKGDAKDASAEGEEPENEDGEGGEDGNLVSPNTSSLVPPPIPVSPASSSLAVSDTVLGMSSNPYVPNTRTDRTRLRFARHCGLYGLLAGPRSGCQTSPARLRYPR